MDKYRKHYITIHAEQIDSACEILERFYEQGDIDHISVSYQGGDSGYLVGIECSTDDLEIITKALRDKQIEVI